MIHRSQLIGGESTENDSSPINVTPEMIISFPPIAASKFAPINTDDKNASFEIKTISTIPFPIDGSLALPIQGILLLPTKTRKEGEKLPVIVVPHGGPHSCSASGYMPGVAYLASKYAVLLPNYRGSTGFGQAALDSLLTRIGRVDVDDVVGLLEESLAEFPQELDRARVGICGGSHGGFLTAHCTSQYEDLFKAAAMRNPVTNIASMITSTDIPDWCMAESLGNYNSSSFRGPTSDQIQVMYSKSPVSRVDRVKSPTLVAIGMADLRVPPSQGLEWFHSLKSNSVPTKLLRYPTDNHALDKVTTEADHWIHIRKWFDDYL
jgi:acylaminoacyl-peptidase